MSTLQVKNLTGPVSDNYNITLQNGGRIIQTGQTLQVVQTLYTTPTSQVISIGTPAQIVGVAVSITPKATTSKILIFARWNGEHASGHLADFGFGIARNGTIINNAPLGGSRTSIPNFAAMGYWNDAGSTPDTMTMFTYDSPASTSSVTYALYGISSYSTPTIYTNRTVADSDAANYERMTCEIIAMEIAG